jgi:hypothetical protein
MEETIYTNLQEAQAALDAGHRVRIAMKPYAFDPALLQLALDFQAKERLEDFKRQERHARGEKGDLNQ